MNPQSVIPWLIGVFLLALAAELVGGHHRLSRQSGRDALFSLTGMIFQVLLAGPFVGVVVGLLLNQLAPGSAGHFAGAPFWAIFPFWFLAEEFGHYWLHRAAHEYPWLWKLHRTHHSAPQLNVGVVYRYNVFWTFLQPQVWMTAAAVYLGFPEVGLASAMTTFVVNIATHSVWRWDLALRRLPGMNPVLNVLERIVTLPDTHHAHHGLGRGAYLKGNYAVTIFLFDVLFGTARIPRARQERFGLPGKFDWKEELFWPVLRERPVRAGK